MAPENYAAYLVKAGAIPLEVKPAPYTAPGPDEIVVKNAALAINPVDYTKQHGGDQMFTWITYPHVLGSDVAGEVVEVGKGGKAAQSFKLGDRVVGFAASLDKRSAGAPEGAFQHYTVLRSHLATKIPDDLSYEKACVLPMSISTAACGLFMKEYNALEYPTWPPKSHEQTQNAVFIVWGGSSSVGCSAIQLAKAAGYEVIATASPKNFGLVKELGASHVYDYHDPDTVAMIIAALKDKTCAGAIAIGIGSLEACIDILAAVPGNGRKFVAQTTVPINPATMSKNFLKMMGVMLGFLWWNVKIALSSRFKGVQTKFIWAPDVIAEDVGKMIYQDFLPKALASGKYLVKPEPQVVGKGLEFLQEAMDTNLKGVSAAKVVVTL
ncbi:zinc-binding oxidoreductase CipB [Annulohypoxylon maeteangense]|uniref:zinc-binding oxidoreductase CipB n=1 Tax=Annulohypoxylon maeteangense TaxID=1927788 RepID=UPI002007FE8F|nr:zinc-binding oxidoreductase CipB [Annulohypoxylon maeteangense]KAI0886809.1 zinc-binding oxidoreductase CipB [Annulohypoxylon maeteangense]